MAERKTPNKGYQKLKSDLSAGNIGQVYIFYGEESYPVSYTHLTLPTILRV